MRELRPGVWDWQSPHPDWDEEQWWPAFVSSYAIEVPIDPAEDPTPSPLKLLAHSTLRSLDTTVCRRVLSYDTPGGRQVLRFAFFPCVSNETRGLVWRPVSTVTTGTWLLWCGQNDPPTKVCLIEPALGISP
jgi:hypothetical protein